MRPAPSPAARATSPRQLEEHRQTSNNSPRSGRTASQRQRWRRLGHQKVKPQRHQSQPGDQQDKLQVHNPAGMPNTESEGHRRVQQCPVGDLFDSLADSSKVHRTLSESGRKVGPHPVEQLSRAMWSLGHSEYWQQRQNPAIARQGLRPHALTPQPPQQLTPSRC